MCRNGEERVVIILFGLDTFKVHEMRPATRESCWIKAATLTVAVPHGLMFSNRAF